MSAVQFIVSRLTLSHLRADLSAGLVAAVVSLPQTVPMGVIAFAPLGDGWVWLGVQAALVSSIVAGLVAALLAGAPLMISGPRASQAVVLGALVAGLAADPAVAAHGGAPLVVALTFFAIVVSGLIQAGFGLCRVGRFIKFIPYPVVSGFMNGVAAVILLGQAAPILGLPAGFSWVRDWRMLPELAAPGAVLVALAAAGAMLVARRWVPKVPEALVGLGAGVAAFVVLVPSWGPEGLGGAVGAVSSALPAPNALAGVLELMGEPWMPGVLAGMLPSILVLALVGSVDSLLAAVGVDVLTDGRHDADRELVAQGLSNIAAGCFGGIASAASLSRSSASVKAGARTRAAGVVCALLTLLATVAAGQALAWLPLSGLAAVLVLLTFDMFDDWSRRLLHRLPQGGEMRGAIVANLAVVAAVAVTTVVVNLMAAVALGVLLSLVLFVRTMSRPIVRTVVDGRARRSLRIRGRDEADTLAAHGRQVLVFELDGPLFFGTADALLAQVLQRASGVRVVILDFRRVRDVDSTGVRILGQLGRELQSKGRALLLAHVGPDDPVGAYAAEIGGGALADVVRLFPDVDRALEWAEEHILDLHGVTPGEGRVLRLGELPLAEGLSEDDIAILTGALLRRELPQGTALFREGEAGHSLYILAKGAITIQLTRPDGPPMRLATFLPGVVFGEMSLLEGQPRSADAVADEDVVVYTLDAEAFEALAEERPAITQRLLRNIARDLAARLRVTSEQVRARA